MKELLMKNLDLIFVDSEIGELMDVCSKPLVSPVGGTVWFCVRSREDRPVWRVQITFDQLDKSEYEENQK